MSIRKRIAVLHQSVPTPAIDGIVKPMKPNGYKDSGADIAFALLDSEMTLVTPEDNPDPSVDEGWSFPDSEEGINRALSRGANTLWLNTVLYDDHPIIQLRAYDKIQFIGQRPNCVQAAEDKLDLNQRLRSMGIPVPLSCVLNLVQEHTNKELRFDCASLSANGVSLPLVVKPIRGRGSQGVIVVRNECELHKALSQYGEASNFPFGTRVMLEAYLPGEECTVAVLPPGSYTQRETTIERDDYWCLTPVKRTGHVDGVTPYNGVVAVANNSRPFDDQECHSAETIELTQHCSSVGRLMSARGVIRIDCRRASDGHWMLFDVNLKPNMTGSGRPGRANQDSLVAIASRPSGWTFRDLIVNLALNSWTS